MQIGILPIQSTINMPNYADLNPGDIMQIMQVYGIHSVDSYSILSGGSENTNYAVTASAQKYVLTLCEQKSTQQARELVDLLDYLAAHNFETSQVIHTSTNEPISHWHQKPVIVKRFLAGNIMPVLPNTILTEVGRQMGKLHSLDAPNYLPSSLSYGRESFQQVQEYMPDSAFGKWLEGIHTYIAAYCLEDLPNSLIHSDIFYSNVIVSTDLKTARIMDFEEAAQYYRVFDLGMAIIGLCENEKKIDLQKANLLLRGYQKKIQLSDMEKGALQAFTVYAAASMAFWRHKNFNYVNPDANMYGHYLHLQVLAAYIYHVPNDTFLKILEI
jgi:homoserine kinase type II